ncbi:MAG TPA: ornithine cyclodeaminase family protein [Acidobacteriota bacterium]|nr:ornithine cyclodeaminase family protein [Acidobacteriota bacterium]
MTRVVTLEQIKRAIDPARVIAALEDGFVAYSEGRAVVPPVGHLDFDDPPGDCHIKCGFISGDEHFVVKVATGFYRNPERGLSSSNGLMLVFSRKTGNPDAVLLDQGWLTDLRTAAAGAIAAKYLAPRGLEKIGIVGTGIQARLQLEWLGHVSECREAMVWGRNPEKAHLYRKDMASIGFTVALAPSIADLCDACNLIVTTTPARTPLIHSAEIRPGTHITAVGADGGGKQELEAELFRIADLRVVDSLAQCSKYGASSYALRAKLIDEEEFVELGRLIRCPELRRRNDRQITIADLTGVAVQDIRIARLVTESLA